jgi:PAS domain S-box-containing protein
MGKYGIRIEGIGQDIIRRVYLMLFVVIVFVGLLFSFYVAQQKETFLFEKKANNYHAKTINLTLELQDEIRNIEIWLHSFDRGKREELLNIPRDFTLEARVTNLIILLDENINKIVQIQNQYGGEVFRSILVKLVRDYERFKITLENTGNLVKKEFFDKQANSFIVSLRQLQLLHDSELSQLRKSIVQMQLDNDKYLFLSAVLVLIIGLWLVIGFMRNIKSVIYKYQVALSDLEQSRKNTETLLQSTDQGIYGMDMEGNCTFANAACLSLLGYKNDIDLIGKNVHQLIHYAYENGDTYPAELCKLGKAHRAGKAIRCDDEVFWRKDGSSIYVEYSSNPILEKDEIAGSVVAFSDISDRKRIETELANQQERLEMLVDERTRDLQHAKQEAERANKLKSDFLGRMSHELRTPMNAILGFGQLMEMEKLSGEQKSYVSEIMKAAKHLLGLIDEVLELSTIEAGKINLVFEDFNAQDMITECVSIMSPYADKQEVSISLQTDACSDIYLRMDRMRTKEVLLNLVSNAIKYNKKQGSVLISCECFSRDSLRVNVIDTGQGIDEEKQFMLFEPFNRLGEEYGETEGTGIGLSISRHLMELMGGKIGMQSVPSGGSIFWMVCNIGHTIRQNNTQAESSAHDKGHLSYSNFKIIYIEDNPANMRLVDNIIANHASEAKMLGAPTAEMGIELARDTRPDVILMDINLPGMDGYEALSRLRNYPETKDIPVIAISAAASPRDIDRGKAAGFHAYLTKPIEVSELINAIENILDKINSGIA